MKKSNMKRSSEVLYNVHTTDFIRSIMVLREKMEEEKLMSSYFCESVNAYAMGPNQIISFPSQEHLSSSPAE
jgi:hypothetical protein